jgi:phosphatidylethanolamine-binding protein (PEBP) family uncharacterized protein
MLPGANGMFIATGVSIIAVGLIGCGGATTSSSSSISSPGSTADAASSPSSTPRRHVEIHDPESTIRLTSPVPLQPIASRYTCDGADVPLPLRWSTVPADTVEQDVVIFELHPPAGRSAESWAVAGLGPSVRAISSGLLPHGAIVGRNNLGKTGYSVCPPHSVSAKYIVRVMTRRHKVHVEPGFDSAAFAKAVVGSSSEDSGLLVFSYARR